ncbi:MAG: transcription elongation factor GreA [Rhodothermales bacterium]
MSHDPVYLTEEGLKKIRDELEFLKTKGRSRIANDIAEARSHGDLSENAEYDAAKDAQGMLEKKIADLEKTVYRARLVDESVIDSSKAYILSSVRVKDLKSGKELTYTLVSPQEADFTVNKISVQSPIGKALLGRSVGDVIDVNVPAGKLQFEILDIGREG